MTWMSNTNGLCCKYMYMAVMLGTSTMYAKLEPAIWSCDTGHIGIHVHGGVDEGLYGDQNQIFSHRWFHTIFSYQS